MLQMLSPDGKIANTNRSVLDQLTLKATDFLQIYTLMLQTRLFEEEATRRAHLGQMPLYISPRGQEAAEVASAYVLEKEDWVFYYARSQGAAFTKGVSIETMWKLFYGIPDPQAIEDFLDHQVMLPYILVGGHLTHTAGFAWARKILHHPGVSIAYCGEGATAQGDFHSALNWVSIYSIPTIIFCENNQYAISTPNRVQTATETFAEKASAYAVVSALIDGNDPFAVYTTTQQALQRARGAHKPTFIEAVTYRLGPHTTAVGEIRKVPEQERLRAEQHDPLKRMRQFLLSQEARELWGLQWTETQDEHLRAELQQRIKHAADIVSNQVDTLDGPAVIAASVALHTQPLVEKGYHDLSPVSFTPEKIPEATGRHALNFALYDTMTFDPRVIILGEDIGDVGGVFRINALPEKFVRQYLAQHTDQIVNRYLPLKTLFGSARCIDTPLDESGIVGHAIGLALGGARPVVEIQFSGFLCEASDHIFGDLGRLLHRSAGLVHLPLVIRLPYGAGPFLEYHRECEISSLLTNPGLTIVCPSTVQDFYDLFWASVASEKPVLFFEHKRLYREIIKETLQRRPPVKPLEEFGIRVAREGTDITVTAYGLFVHTCLEAAERLAKEGISVEVLDLRVIAPFDRQTFLHSFQKTGRLVTVQEEPKGGSFGLQLAGMILEDSEAVCCIKSPFACVAPPFTHAPVHTLWKQYTPQLETVIQTIKQTMQQSF
jgi:2-oxoisovalerate dehydrogenase E1 component